jgi:hypothetical protein
MEEFVGWLAETPYPWDIASNGKIRAHVQDAEICAITGVVRHRTGIAFSVGDWVRAADMLGLSYMEAGLIVAAVDEAGPSGARTHLLRKRLLVATRLEASRAAGSTKQDPMDRALADLIASVGTGDAGPSPVGQETQREDQLVPA